MSGHARFLQCRTLAQAVLNRKEQQFQAARDL